MIPALHLVMHAVAIKKHGSADELAPFTGLDREAVDEALAHALDKGRVAETGGKYMLTPAGQMIVGGEYSRFYDGLREDEAFIKPYEQFERINTELKQLITDWQTMEIGGKRVENDHSDASYDEEIIGRIGDLHERFEPVLARMIAKAPRLEVYREKPDAALEKAEDGDIAWVSDAKTESYHTVWFEMHEDLLRMLGRQREE